MARSEVVESNLIFTAGNIVSAVLSFVFSIALARLLQPVDFGIFSFVTTVAGFFIVFTDLGTSSTVGRFVAHYIGGKEAGKAKAVFRLLLGYRTLLAGATGAGLAFLHPVVAGLFGKPELGMYVLAAGAVVVASSLLDFFYSSVLSLKQFRSLFALRVVERGCRLLFATGLVLLGFGVAGAIGGLVLASAAGVAVGAAAIVRSPAFRVRVQPLERRKLIRFGLWSLLHSVLIIAYSLVDALLLSALRPVVEVGFFSISFNWAQVITYFVPVSAVALFPYFSEGEGERSGSLFATSIRYTILITLPLALLVSAFSPSIIRLFYGIAYLEAVPVLSLLSLVAIPITISSIFTYYFIGIGKPRIPAITIATVFVAAVGLNLILIPLMGVMGAAIAMVAARYAEMVLLAGVALRNGLRFPGRFIGMALAASLIMVAAALYLPTGSFFLLIASGVGSLLLYGALAIGLRLLTIAEVKQMAGSLSRLARRKTI